MYNAIFDSKYNVHLLELKMFSFSVLCEGKERLISGCDILDTTPQGHSANISDSASHRIFITYRRSSAKVTHTSLAVTHINVIITSKVRKNKVQFCLSEIFYHQKSEITNNFKLLSHALCTFVHHIPFILYAV